MILSLGKQQPLSKWTIRDDLGFDCDPNSAPAPRSLLVRRRECVGMFGIRFLPGVRLDVMTKEQREEWAEDEKNQTLALVGWLVGWL